MYVPNTGSNDVSVIGEISISLEGIFGSGNNINIQIQQNTGNIVTGPASSDGSSSYADESIFQGQSTCQNSNVVS